MLPSGKPRGRHASSLSPCRVFGRAGSSVGDDNYDGRVTYDQWQNLFATSSQGCRSRGRSCPLFCSRDQSTLRRDASISNSTLQIPDSLGADTWLLVLLFCCAPRLAAITSVCRFFIEPCIECKAISAWMPVTQLAAWLRCGMSLVRDELPNCEIPMFPPLCRSWVELLMQQELYGKFCSVLCIRSEIKLVIDFPEAVNCVNALEGNQDYDADDVLIYILPNTSWHTNISSRERTIIKHPVSVRGFALPSHFSSRPVLWLDGFKIQTSGTVEFCNLLIIGTGSEEAEPRGLFDSVIWVTQGWCSIRDVDISFAAGTVGFGIAVGPVPLSTPDNVPAQAELQGTSVSQCSVGCLVYSGGQLVVGSGSSVFDCNLCLSASDRGSLITVARGTSIVSRNGSDERVSTGGLIQHED